MQCQWYEEACVDLFYRWICPCSMPAWMLKKPSGFSTECIIFASFILISGWWSPDYTVSFCCRSSWSLQKKREKKEDWNVETVVLLFSGDRKDAPACRFILMWHIIAQKLFLKLGWKKSQGRHREAVIWQTCLGCMPGKLRGVGTMAATPEAGAERWGEHHQPSPLSLHPA